MQEILEFSLKFSDNYKKDLKKLSKRFRTLEDDMKTFCKFSLPQFIGNKQTLGYYRISSTGIDYPEYYICKKIACKSIAGKGANTGLRRTFTVDQLKHQIRFIELFYKGDKELEDFSRFKFDAERNR